MKLNVEVTIPDEFINKLVTREVLEEILKKYLDDGGIIIPPPDPEPEPLEKCKAGPEIRRISILSDKQLQVNFYGENVTEIKFSLFKENKLIESQIFNPKNDLPILNLQNKLTNGKYVLKFEGTLCKGENSQEFTFTEAIPQIPSNKLETTFYFSGK